MSGCADVPGPLFRTLPLCTSVFSNLPPGRIILGATCGKKQLKKEIRSEMEVVMFNSFNFVGGPLELSLGSVSFGAQGKRR